MAGEVARIAAGGKESELLSMTAIKEQQEQHGDGNENGRAPKRERRNVIIIAGSRGNEINDFVENHRAADAESCRREETQ